jgi:SAM-dependent methyltransferase
VPSRPDPPAPPAELASRVFRLEKWSDPARVFEEMGAQTKRSLLDLLPDDWSFEGTRVLDFGCGAGRTLRHFLDEAEHGELWGADIDEPSIEWLRANLCPPLHAWKCATWPPLGLEHVSFDLIWAISVFTHLTHNSIPWLLELHRLLRPEGLLIATYMGRSTSEILAHEPWDEDRVGMNILRHDQGWDAGGPAVLMSDWWVRAHWGRAFEIVDVAHDAHHMSWALMRKREGDFSIDDIETPSDDPRELLAFRHNVRQVQREVEAIRVEHRMELNRLREEYERALNEGRARLAEQNATIERYENSASWRITRPVRAAGERFRGRRSSSP